MKKKLQTFNTWPSCTMATLCKYVYIALNRKQAKRKKIESNKKKKLKKNQICVMDYQLLIILT